MSDRGETGSRPARILVVEDQYSIREFTRVILANAGYEVAVAMDGAEAVEAVRDKGFDLVLMDVDMPVMDGPTATRHIRALEGPRSKVPIVAFSGNGQSLAASGINDYIGKPFRKGELLVKVEAWLKRDPGSATPVHLPGKPTSAALAEALELMGRPWALLGLTRLKAQIDEAFATDLGAVRNHAELIGQAHALVSLAAVLGFTVLSERCSALEEACRNKHDVRPPFERARAEALQARAATIDLISDLQIEEASA